MVVNTESEDYSKTNENKINVTIPLSKKAIDIKLDYREFNQESSVIKDEGFKINNIVLFTSGIILTIISLIMLIKFIQKLFLLFNKRSLYDRFIAKTLKEYDRLIAETSTLISFNEKDVIKISRFTELLDIHDNLGLPIMYYPIVQHSKCYFYISHNNALYLLVVKAVDLENEKKK